MKSYEISMKLFSFELITWIRRRTEEVAPRSVAMEATDLWEPSHFSASSWGLQLNWQKFLHLPSGYLTVRHGKLPIYSRFSN